MSDQGGVEAEIRALEAVLTVLEPLDEATRLLVLAYAHERFGVGGRLPDLSAGMPVQREEPLAPEAAPPLSKPEPSITDIRTLKETKKPKSAVEMAVITAYYVRELAPADKRKATIGTKEIDDYFKQADYPLPSAPGNVLMSAKNSGYLDVPARGQYSLNPVGYNLVAHGLPRASGAASRTKGGPGTTKSRKKRTTARSKKTTVQSKKVTARKPTSFQRKKQTPKS